MANATRPERTLDAQLRINPEAVRAHLDGEWLDVEQPTFWERSRFEDPIEVEDQWR